MRLNKQKTRKTKGFTVDFYLISLP